MLKNVEKVQKMLSPCVIESQYRIAIFIQARQIDKLTPSISALCIYLIDMEIEESEHGEIQANGWQIEKS